MIAGYTRVFVSGWLGLAAALGLASASAPASADLQADLVLVKDGKANAVVIADGGDTPPVQWAVEDLRDHVRRATSVELPLLSADEAAGLGEETVRIVVGGGPLARSLGVSVEDLEPGAYRIRTVGNHVVFAGHDAPSNAGWINVRWLAGTTRAVDRFLDEQLGVLWLWPGDVGTHVPRHERVVVPAMDLTWRPDMVKREMRYGLHAFRKEGEQQKRLFDEAHRWLTRQGMGDHARLRFGHAFIKWWDRYHEEHPEYFAMSPAGKRELRGGVKGAKLCVSNEAVDEAILAEWREAGMPDNWNVSPNDGVGFCTCDGCRAMDEPKDQDPELIWSTPQANLTARYLKFWNRVLGKMRQHHPGVTLSSYAYSAYRDPPRSGDLRADGLILQVVHTYWSREQWQGWSDLGAKLVLRPNWWHSGAVAPHVPLHSVGEFFKFAQQNGLIGFHFDSLHGYWATHGPNYYLIARLASRPEMSVDDVLDEYCSAFGAAAPTIRDYWRYWEDLADRAKYPVAAGGEVMQETKGLYEQILSEAGAPLHPIFGSWHILPYLYTDETLAPAYEMLAKADALVSESDDGYVRQRVAFLRDGLDHLRLTRDVVRLGFDHSRPEGATVEQFRALVKTLNEKRQTWTTGHAIWADPLGASEKRRGVPTHEENTEWTADQMQGI